MFIVRCSTFNSIVSCLFEFILMPESSLQGCYMMLICWNWYNLIICHFCCILCVHPMSMISTCILYYIMPSLQGYHTCIFVTLVLSASSLLSRVLAVTVLLGWICYFVMLCKPAATSHSMHNLEMFTKDVLLYMSCSIHTCPWVHLYPALACCDLALKLLNNVAVSLLTLSSDFPCALLVIHAPYELSLAMYSFIDMYSYCWSHCRAMYCSVVSGTSSRTCLLIVVPAMF